MADNFGLKIGLEGEKEFKKALADINQSFKVLGSEMKVVQSQFDKNDDSVEALTARNQVLGKEIDAQKKKIETLRQTLENASTSFGENDRRTQQWQIQLNNAQAALNNMERELELTKRCIEENSTTAQDQAAYLERYNGLAERYETAKAKLEKLQAEKAQREAKAEDIGGFMFELAEYGESLTEFDDRLWLTVIDIVTVHRDGRLTFKFQTGHEMLE